MKNTYTIFLIICIFFCVGCSKQNTIFIFYAGENIDSNIVYNDIIINNSTIEYHLALSLDETVYLEDFIELRTFEFRLNDTTFIYGTDYTNKLNYGENYVFLLDNQAVEYTGNIELLYDNEYQLSIVIDLNNDTDVSLSTNIDQILLELVINHNTVILGNKTQG